MHIKCRNNIYPRSNIKRFCVPDDKVNFNVQWDEYAPQNYTSENIKRQPKYADLPINTNNHKFNWNHIDNGVNRKSFLGDYYVINGIPRNLMGRTGIVGRGNLGRWGPNHASDIILTRLKADSHNSDAAKNLYDIIQESMNVTPTLEGNKLQFLAIKRKNDNLWAFPGGFVDVGEDAVSDTAPREFLEEAFSYISLKKDENNDKVKQLVKAVKELIAKHGTIVYQGYVDDPRNTDNAWMETTALNVHINCDIVKNDKILKITNPEDYKILEDFPLKAGDDATDINWIDITKANLPNLKQLYASHFDIVKIIAQNHNVVLD